MEHAIAELLTSNLLDLKCKKNLRDQPTFFPVFIQNLSYNSRLKISDVNRNMLVGQGDYFNVLNQVNWMLVIWLITNCT